MRCNAWRWLWGLIPLAIVWWIGILGEHDRIEADLKRRTQDALALAKAPWVSSTFSGRDATLTGGAADARDQQEAADIANRVWGVRVVDNRTSLAGRPASYLWSAARGEKGIELGGFVPGESARQAVLANVRAAVPGQPIEDRMRIARGVDNAEQWLSGIKFGLAQLAALRTGRVEVADGGLIAEGEAMTTASYRAIKTAFSGAMPAGLALRSDKVTPPPVAPYTWAAAHKAGRLELTGHAPGERQRDLVLALAKSLMPKANVEDRMTIAAGEPRGWQGVANVVLPHLARMIEGRAELIDQRLRVTGLAESESRAEQIRSGLASEVPSGIQVGHAIEIDPQMAAAEAKRAADAAAARQRTEAEAAQRQRSTEEEASRQRAAAEEAAKRKAAADEAARQQAAEAARRLAEETARKAAAEDAAKRAAAEAAARQPEVRATVDRCQTLLNSAAKQGRINFQRASADITPASYPTLNELARIAAECPNVEIDIVGHTDSEGTPERNQRLSERRAAAVVGYLADAGIDDARLHAIGFGQSQPVAPNDTAENRAKNRRIEFIVRMK